MVTERVVDIGQDLGLGNGAGGETVTISTENREGRAVWGSGGRRKKEEG